jgi:hypothetical protein
MNRASNYCNQPPLDRSTILYYGARDERWSASDRGAFRSVSLTCYQVDEQAKLRVKARLRLPSLMKTVVEPLAKIARQGCAGYFCASAFKSEELNPQLNC